MDTSSKIVVKVCALPTGVNGAICSSNDADGNQIIEMYLNQMLDLDQRAKVKNDLMGTLEGLTKNFASES